MAKKKKYMVCFDIGFAEEFEGTSAEDVEDYIRNLMSDDEFNTMVVNAMSNPIQCEIDIEVVPIK